MTIKLCLPNLVIGLGAAILIPYMNIFFHDKFFISDQVLGLFIQFIRSDDRCGVFHWSKTRSRNGQQIKAVVLTRD